MRDLTDEELDMLERECTPGPDYPLDRPEDVLPLIAEVRRRRTIEWLQRERCSGCLVYLLEDLRHGNPASDAVKKIADEHRAHRAGLPTWTCVNCECVYSPAEQAQLCRGCEVAMCSTCARIRGYCTPCRLRGRGPQVTA